MSNFDNQEDDKFYDVIDYEDENDEVIEEGQSYNTFSYRNLLDTNFSNIYLGLVEFINRVQSITNGTWYKIFVGGVCALILWYYAIDILNSYVKVYGVRAIVAENDKILEKINKNKTFNTFLNDSRLFYEASRYYLETNYEDIVKLLNNNSIQLKVHHQMIDKFLDHCNVLNAFITALPLILNLSWWSTIISVVGSVMGRYYTDIFTELSLKMTATINISVGMVLLLIHFCNLYCLLIVKVQKKKME